ncbi:MAG: dTDP-4-dehydrorhamnose reductase [Bdellovibrionota bacterium]
MVLVFGSNGQLASSLKSTGFAREATYLGSDRVDFLRAGSIERALDSHRPRLIVNASAYTKVDAAESDRQACELVNATAPQRIGKWAKENDASVVHFSTDYVFPGTGTSAWTEDDTPAPVNWYGETKLRGELLLRESGCHAVTFRTSWVFSEFGSNFVKTMLRLGKSNDELKVVSDQIGNPTYAADIAEFLDRTIEKIESREVSGTYHLSNAGPTSWYEFAEHIFARAAELGHPLRIKSVAPIPSSQYPTPARRPLNGSLCLERTKRAFDDGLPPWRDAVDRCLVKMGLPVENT